MLNKPIARGWKDGFNWGYWTAVALIVGILIIAKAGMALWLEIPAFVGWGVAVIFVVLPLAKRQMVKLAQVDQEQGSAEPSTGQTE